jgi:hypothetical protein
MSKKGPRIEAFFYEKVIYRLDDLLRNILSSFSLGHQKEELLTRDLERS